MTADRREWDLIVVGLGALGSGAAYWASTHPGARVLGLEQFEFGHGNGASADHSRIIRLSYHRPDYVRLAKRAHETWAQVEAESGERLATAGMGGMVAKTFALDAVRMETASPSRNLKTGPDSSAG